MLSPKVAGTVVTHIPPVKVVVAVVAVALKIISESGTVTLIVPMFGPLGTCRAIDCPVNEIVCPPVGTTEFSLITELNQV